MELSNLFKALSDPTRLRIINLLMEIDGCCVCDLEKVLGETQSKISRHLSYLKRENIVQDERCGTMIIYKLNLDTEINQKLLDFLKDLYNYYPEFSEDGQKLQVKMKNGELSSLDANGVCTC